MEAEVKEETIGQMADRLHSIREEKRALEVQIGEKGSQLAELEARLMARMELEGVSKITGNKCTVYINDMVVPHVEDWEAFYRYIKRNGYFQLLERRPSKTGCRELFERAVIDGKKPGQAIPGVVPFEKKQLNIRSSND